VLINKEWASVCWDFYRHHITVFGSGHPSAKKKERWATHMKVVSELTAGLRLCLKHFFNGWEDTEIKWPGTYIEARPKDHRAENAIWYVFSTKSKIFYSGLF
jgi:hypothetical protein